jgi:hypothetical protein
MKPIVARNKAMILGKGIRNKESSLTIHFYRPDYKKLTVLRVCKSGWGKGFTGVSSALLFFCYLDDLPQDTYYGTDSNLSLVRSEGCHVYSWHEGTFAEGRHFDLHGTALS